jgi:hypothetical protein
MAPGKLRNRLPQHFPDLMLLAHAQFALLPPLANLELDSLENILEKHGQRHPQIVRLQELSHRCRLPLEEFAGQAIGHLRQWVCFTRSEALPDLVQREPLLLPELDLADTFQILLCEETVSSRSRSTTWPIGRSASGWGMSTRLPFTARWPFLSSMLPRIHLEHRMENLK